VTIDGELFFDGELVVSKWRRYGLCSVLNSFTISDVLFKGARIISDFLN